MDAYRTSLPEDLLLLCVEPVSGRLRQPSLFHLALAGGVLAELLAAEAAVLDGRRLVLSRTAPLGHPALDDAVRVLNATAAPPRGATLSRCLHRLGRRVAAPYLDSLIQRGLLQPQSHKLLGLIPVTRYTAADRSAHDACVALVADAVLDPNAPARTLQLAALAHAGDLSRRLYPGRANRPAQRRLADLARLDPVAKAVRDAVRAAKDTQTGSG
ncbi:hypothetical protein ABIA33_003890 [Streptacidiphilus sp. MAP12-16]|uniref:GOLPH3/VPS74 family protein n=1 Tax=Streptacidiphilus sp. MAP12-16 TaxID=3156300 RepID=UPI003515BB65